MVGKAEVDDGGCSSFSKAAFCCCVFGSLMVGKAGMDDVVLEVDRGPLETD